MRPGANESEPGSEDSCCAPVRNHVRVGIESQKTNSSIDVARLRRKVAWRILPLVFLLYIVAYLDRANVGFAKLRMASDLHFSDAVYGLGIGIFFIGYLLLEIPGALLVERWSARKWFARILISWVSFQRSLRL
jgi:MFS transporter, ACS family, tartrate transporter